MFPLTIYKDNSRQVAVNYSNGYLLGEYFPLLIKVTSHCQVPKFRLGSIEISYHSSYYYSTSYIYYFDQSRRPVTTYVCNYLPSQIQIHKVIVASQSIIGLVSRNAIVDNDFDVESSEKCEDIGRKFGMEFLYHDIPGPRRDLRIVASQGYTKAWTQNTHSMVACTYISDRHIGYLLDVFRHNWENLRIYGVSLTGLDQIV